MVDPNQPTCGHGLAGNAALPRALANLMAALSDVLEAHKSALDLTDEDSRVENDACLELISRQRQAAGNLSAIAAEMAGYQDLPESRHDQDAMTHPRLRTVFEKLVGRKEELSTLLRETAGRDQSILDRMRAADGDD